MTASLIDQFAAKRAARLAGVKVAPPATAGAGADVPATAGQHPPAFAPCSRPSGVHDLFGDGSPTPCGSRHLWIDGYGNVRCCVCQQPPSMVMVRRMVWLSPDGTVVNVSGGEESNAGSVDAAGVPAKSDDLPDPRIGPIFIGDPRVKLRIKAQQQPGEAFDDWWERSAETTGFLFALIKMKADGTLPVAGAKKTFEKPDKMPPGSEEYYLVRVLGGGGGDGGEDAGGSLKIVNAKAAARYKSKVAVTFTGAKRWWYLKEDAEEMEAAAGKPQHAAKSK